MKYPVFHGGMNLGNSLSLDSLDFIGFHWILCVAKKVPTWLWDLTFPPDRPYGLKDLFYLKTGYYGRLGDGHASVK